MRLLLIRHGETVDNVAGIYAGIRDSPLTTHGVLQASRLASHLTNVKVSHIFSSDLQRAFKTAELIRLAQSPAPTETIKLELLREQNFGFYEGKSYLERQKGGEKSGKEAHRDIHAKEEKFQDVESKESMQARVNEFIDSHLLEHFLLWAEEETVVIVAHGIILSHLWRGILRRFADVYLDTGVSIDNGRGLEYLGGWSNTGYLDLEIRGNNTVSLPYAALKTADPSILNPLAQKLSNTENLDIESREKTAGSSIPQASTLKPADTTTNLMQKLPNMLLVVKAVNSLEHLRGLKKTRGGIGSAKHDEKQQSMDSFFKKQKF